MQVPSFILNLLGNPTHESDDWTWFIYSQTILFLACVTRQRIRSSYNEEPPNTTDTNNQQINDVDMNDQIEPDEISESSRTGVTSYEDYKARVKREQDSHVGEATSAIWSLLSSLWSKMLTQVS